MRRACDPGAPSQTFPFEVLRARRPVAWPFRISHSGTIRGYSSPFSVNAVSARPYIDKSVDPKPGVTLVGGGGPPRSIQLSLSVRPSVVGTIDPARETVPCCADKAPYFAALVANSWTINAKD